MECAWLACSERYVIRHSELPHCQADSAKELCLEMEEGRHVSLASQPTTAFGLNNGASIAASIYLAYSRLPALLDLDKDIAYLLEH